MTYKSLFFVTALFLYSSLSNKNISYGSGNEQLLSEHQPKVITSLTLTNNKTNSIVKIKVDAQTRYTSFFLENPTRLVVDFDGAEINFKKPEISKEDLFIKNISSFTFSKKNFSRVELLLKKKPSYALTRLEDGLSLELTVSEEEASELKNAKTKIERLENEIHRLQQENALLNNNKRHTANNIPIPQKDRHPKAQKTDEQKYASLKKIHLQWIDAWEKKDMDAFISLFSEDFQARDMDLAQWKKYKQKTFDTYEAIIISAKNVQIILRNNKNHGKIEFLQTFWGDSYTDTGLKKIYLRLESDEWKIIRETWNPIQK